VKQHVYQWTVVSSSKHYTDQTKHGGQVQSGCYHHLNKT